MEWKLSTGEGGFLRGVHALFLQMLSCINIVATHKCAIAPAWSLQLQVVMDLESSSLLLRFVTALVEN